MAVERVLSKFPKTEVPEDAVCYICMDREGPDGDAVLRGCACRGPSAGFAHAQCLAEMAARDEWMTVEGGGQLNRWIVCGTCHQCFTGALALELRLRCWRQHYRDASVTEVRCRALTNLGMKLVGLEEFDVAQRLYQEARRGVADHDPIYRSVILPAEIYWASALQNAARPRDALENLIRIGPRVCEDALRRVYNKCMGAALGDLGRVQEALPFVADALELARKSLGSQSAATLDTMVLQAQLVARIGRVEEAKATLDHVLAVQTRIFGPDHEHIRRTQAALRSISFWTP